MAATKKIREPRQTKTLPVLFFGSNLEVMTTTYYNRLQCEWMPENWRWSTKIRKLQMAKIPGSSLKTTLYVDASPLLRQIKIYSYISLIYCRYMAY